MKMSVERWWNDTGRGDVTTGRTSCLSATLSTINRTGTELDSNLGLRGKRPATNRLRKYKDTARTAQ
jgi:hypothetical protein